MGSAVSYFIAEHKVFVIAFFIFFIIFFIAQIVEIYKHREQDMNIFLQRTIIKNKEKYKYSGFAYIKLWNYLYREVQKAVIVHQKCGTLFVFCKS